MIESLYKAAKEKGCLTLLGMSGVGKTWAGLQLAEMGADIYSVDYEIGTKFLAEHMPQELREKMSVTDISWLQRFLGMPGDHARGGVALAQFKERQRLYIEAEISAMQEAIELAKKRHSDAPPFIIDAAGSLCEIEDQELLRDLANVSEVVYLKPNAEAEALLLSRALSAPKPLYYPPALLDALAESYCQENGIVSIELADPKAFFLYAFPQLFKSRLPKYEAMAGSVIEL
tara:strand:- start:1050 stop:1742 length:693 start_codon:yes stop_codon:yes gene_type:complete